MKDHHLTNLIDHLKLNPKQFSECLGFDRVDRVYNVLKFKNGLSSNLASIITEKYPLVDYDWLITGEGEMLKSTNTQDVLHISEYDAPHGISEYSATFRPHINSVYASCGSPNGFSGAIMHHEAEAMSLPYMDKYDFSIRAGGDSMINRSNPKRSIRNKDIVACKYWKTRNYIRWGEVYALATSEGVVIKKIVESLKEGCVKCVSFNEEDNFPPYDLPIGDIADWAIVVGVVSVTSW